MATTAAKYYVVFLRTGHYTTLPVEDEFEAHHQIHYLENKPTTEVLGVFDPRDSQFHWSIPEQARQAHMDPVSELTAKIGMPPERSIIKKGSSI